MNTYRFRFGWKLRLLVLGLFILRAAFRHTEPVESHVPAQPLSKQKLYDSAHIHDTPLW